ncbi:MAG: hypothetical protein KBG15_22815, partial [Kofleriaceae bacterium]|nr:hypothetical protein [Kofleriaceae bacterium]
MVDQRRFDNQRSPRRRGSAPQAAKPTATASPAITPASDDTWVSARVAASYLGIDIRTLYAYVSRGAVRSAPAPT